jgi:LacI family transcriptional regulator
MEKKIRIKDIAKLAQVSIGTVDRVIHNRGEVAEDSRKKIVEILEKTGYKPNLLAQTLSSNKVFKIAALVPNPSQDEYWGLSNEGILQAKEEWAHYNNVKLQLFHFDLYHKESFKELADTLLATEPHAILTAPIFYQEATEFFQKCRSQNIPFALVNNNIKEAGPLSFIGQDLHQSGRLGAELLHLNDPSPGTYAILHVYDDIHNSVHLYEKEKGFKEYFLEKGAKKFNVISVDLNYTHEPTLEKELNGLLNEPLLKGILVTTSRGASIVSKLMEKRGKNGIRLVSYDLLKENVWYLKLGIIDFLINQNSKQQAFIGIKHLANYLLFKKLPSSSFLFPLEIISPENISSYLKQS